MTNKTNIINILDKIYDLDQNDRENLTQAKINIDKENLEKVEDILKNNKDDLLKYGTDKNILTVWLIIQHGSYAKQKEYLGMLEEFVKIGKLDKSNIALTIDRILVGENKPQKYGTQITRESIDGDWVLYEIEDLKNVDKRRKEVGLGSLKEYVELFSDIKLTEEQRNFLSLTFK